MKGLINRREITTWVFSGIAGNLATDLLKNGVELSAKAVDERVEHILEDMIGPSLVIPALIGSRFRWIEFDFSHGKDGYLLKATGKSTPCEAGLECADFARPLVEAGLLFKRQAKVRIKVDVSALRRPAKRKKAKRKTKPPPLG